MNSALNIFLDEEKYYLSLQTEYASRYNELYEKVRLNEFRKEYSKGGEILHRGYYCPSPIQDIVIGNCNRGRKYKNSPLNNDYNFEYIFNKQNQLICINNWSDFSGIFRIYSTEFLIYSCDEVLSIVFTHKLEYEKKKISVISKCYYTDNRIIQYDWALCNLYVGGSGVVEIRKEKYEYDNEQLTECLFEVFNRLALIYSQRKFYFNHGIDGYLSTYSVQEYKDGNPKQSVWDGHDFKVTKKRKV